MKFLNIWDRKNRMSRPVLPGGFFPQLSTPLEKGMSSSLIDDQTSSSTSTIKFGEGEESTELMFKLLGSLDWMFIGVRRGLIS